MDLDLSVGIPGDIVVAPPFTELTNTFLRCDMDWAAQPKGVIAVAANRLVDLSGTSVARGIAVLGDITRPWLAMADADGLCQLNERSLAHEVGHVLSLGHGGPAGGLMISGGTGATLSLAQANQARNYLNNNPILDPPKNGADPNLADMVFDEDQGQFGADTGHLDIAKISAMDRTATVDSFSVHLALNDLLPTSDAPFPLKYYIALDTDNNPTTGGDPRGLVSNLTLDGAEAIIEVEISRLAFAEADQKGAVPIAFPTLHIFEPMSGTFEPFNPPSILQGFVNNVSLLIDYLPGVDGPDTIPIFSQVSFFVTGSFLLANSVLPAGAGMGRLFPEGLKLQATAVDANHQTGIDLGPNEPAVMDFPEIVFPSIIAPEQARPGEEILIQVSDMPPQAELVVFLGQFENRPGVATNERGEGLFLFTIPDEAPLGDTLISVGIDDPDNAMTADTSIRIVDSIFVDGFESGNTASWTRTLP